MLAWFTDMLCRIPVGKDEEHHETFFDILVRETQITLQELEAMTYL